MLFLINKDTITIYLYIHKYTVIYIYLNYLLLHDSEIILQDYVFMLSLMRNV